MLVHYILTDDHNIKINVNTKVDVCITFTGMYHGLILMILRRVTKIRDVEMHSNRNDNELSNSIIKWDRFIFIVYLIMFVWVNFAYFIHYYE